MRLCPAKGYSRVFDDRHLIEIIGVGTKNCLQEVP